MKKISLLAILLCVLVVFAACSSSSTESETTAVTESAQIGTSQISETEEIDDGVVDIELSDAGILVDGEAISEASSNTVYAANDIVYYEEGKDFTYGEGTEADAHSSEEAAAHTVVHITKAGEYKVKGKLSKGQIAIDLGKDAKDDPTAVVTLILDGADITCDVAPAVIFYNVYECSSSDAESATKDVDTSSAGANVIIADGTENNVNGSYVARIYKPESVVLSEDGTEVEDASKLHKYDAAFYSKMSMNINGGNEGAGVLNINAANEGLDSELHLTINGGIINIFSGNDGINTNEDGVSVTTVNGGKLNITVTGETGEGDGIDSNGWLVINGGEVYASACSLSADAGIDSDMGIHINGGTVAAAGNMLDRIEDGGQTYAVFNFRQKQNGSDTISLKNSAGETIAQLNFENDYSTLIYSSSSLLEDTYSLYSGDVKLSGSSGGMMGGHGMQGERPEGMISPDMPEGMEHPEGMERPEGMEHPEGMEMPEGMAPPDGYMHQDGGRQDWQEISGEVTPDFVIKGGGNMFSVVVSED